MIDPWLAMDAVSGFASSRANIHREFLCMQDDLEEQFGCSLHVTQLRFSAFMVKGSGKFYTCWMDYSEMQRFQGTTYGYFEHKIRKALDDYASVPF